jgi:hypothetical protein
MKKLLLPMMFFIFSTVLSQEDEKQIQIPDPIVFETTHQGTFHGKAISYKAISGETFLKNSEGESVAALWSTSYIKPETDSASGPSPLFSTEVLVPRRFGSIWEFLDPK